MIKNSKKIVSGVLCLLLSWSVITLFSCKHDGISDDTANQTSETADLRNYDSNGDIYTGNSRNAARKLDADPEFSARMAEERWSFYRVDRTYIGGDKLPQWVKDTITIEDWENGIKIVYHRPDDQPDFAASTKELTWFSVSYIDGNDNVSTSTKGQWGNMNENKALDKWDPAVRETFTVEYPLVNPGRKVLINVHYGYSGDNEFGLTFEVMPTHGKGCIKDLKKNFTSAGEPNNPESIKHAILKDTEEGLILFIKNVVPPEGENLKQSYNIYGQNGTSKYFDTDWTQLGWKEEVVEDPSKKFTVDLSKFSEYEDTKHLKYLFCEFAYTYELEEFPGLVFETPIFKTEIIESNKFWK